MDLTKLIESEANKQVKALAAMEIRLDKRSVALQKELYALIRDRFLDSLARDESGKLLYNASNLNRVNNMAATWEYFRESSFRPEVMEFGKDLISIVDVEAGYFMAIGKEFNIPMEFDQVRELISKQIGTLDFGLQMCCDSQRIVIVVVCLARTDDVAKVTDAPMITLRAAEVIHPARFGVLNDFEMVHDVMV